jgi:hypothetical protein
MVFSRRLIEPVIPQGIDERIAYFFSTTPWGGVPTPTLLKAYDVIGLTQYEDVTSTVYPSVIMTVTGDYIFLPLLVAIVIGHVYRIEVQWTRSGNTQEAWFEVKAER